MQHRRRLLFLRSGEQTPRTIRDELDRHRGEHQAHDSLEHCHGRGTGTLAGPADVARLKADGSTLRGGWFTGARARHLLARAQQRGVAPLQPAIDELDRDLRTCAPRRSWFQLF
jgi:hypothetical protein